MYVSLMVKLLLWWWWWQRPICVTHTHTQTAQPLLSLLPAVAAAHLQPLSQQTALSAGAQR